MKYPALCLAIIALSGCAGSNRNPRVVERVVASPATLSVQAQGELLSSKPTMLTVPGQQWSHRQLAWMLPDGSRVKAGDVVARFTAPQSKLQLSDALIDLQRNALTRAEKQAGLETGEDKLHVDKSEVAGQLAIAKRYAHASEEALPRDAILDAVQDEHFLGVKSAFLDWREHTAARRGKAELALVDAKRATSELIATQRKQDLKALELRAPHAGLLVLQADWSGQKPRIGAAMWAGNSFASLPDTDKLEVQLQLPQAQAQSVQVGQRVELAPLGAPTQNVESKISWVAAAAATRSRESPVKYLSMKAKVPAATAERYHWAPGQRFVGRIILLAAEHAITVPNIAIDSDGDDASVQLRENGRDVRRPVKLGVRGPARSQILAGLKPGDRIVINTVSNTPSPDSNPQHPTAAKARSAP